MSKTNTSPKPNVRSRLSSRAATPKRLPDGGMDWAAFRAMTEEEVVARALTDPDNLPRTKEQLARMKRTPRVAIIRRVFRMTQEEFADAFRIPIGTLRDWEQGRSEPDQANQAYLKVIARAPHTVRKALAAKPGEPPIEKMEFND